MIDIPLHTTFSPIDINSFLDSLSVNDTYKINNLGDFIQLFESSINYIELTITPTGFACMSFGIRIIENYLKEGTVVALPDIVRTLLEKLPNDKLTRIALTGNIVARDLLQRRLKWI